MGPGHVLTKRVKDLVPQGLLKLSGSKIWGVTDGPGFYQHRPKRFLLFLLSVSSSALFVSVWACGGGFRFMFVVAIVFPFSICISVVRCFLFRFTFASHSERVRYVFLFHRLFCIFSSLYRVSCLKASLSRTGQNVILPPRRRHGHGLYRASV